MTLDIRFGEFEVCQSVVVRFRFRYTLIKPERDHNSPNRSSLQPLFIFYVVSSGFNHCLWPVRDIGGNQQRGFRPETSSVKRFHTIHGGSHVQL